MIAAMRWPHLTEWLAIAFMVAGFWAVLFMVLTLWHDYRKDRPMMKWRRLLESLGRGLLTEHFSMLGMGVCLGVAFAAGKHGWPFWLYLAGLAVVYFPIALGEALWRDYENRKLFEAIRQRLSRDAR